MSKVSIKATNTAPNAHPDKNAAKNKRSDSIHHLCQAVNFASCVIILFWEIITIDRNGLKYKSSNWKYRLTVDLPKVRNLDGISGPSFTEIMPEKSAQMPHEIPGFTEIFPEMQIHKNICSIIPRPYITYSRIWSVTSNKANH